MEKGIMDTSTLACNARELSEGLEKAIWELLHAEAMYAELDLEDEETLRVVSETLNKIAKELTEEE
jgi:hypothetical protein